MTPKLTEELILVSKLRSLQIDCAAFDGLTTPEQRRDRVRAAMQPVLDVTYTVKDGKRVTISEQFERVYGEA